MSRPLPLHEPAERARHGGTTAPSRTSVWDLSTRPDPSDVSTEHLTRSAVDDVTEHPAGSPFAADVTVQPATARGGSVATVLVAAVATAVVIGALYLVTARTGDAGPGRAPTAVTPTDAPPSISELAGRGGAAGAAELFAAGPEPTMPPATVPETVPPANAPPATAPPATVPPEIVPPVSVPATMAPAGPRVEIVTRTEPCKFGANCLVAGYVLHEFSSPPSEFVCEFASGNRFTFGAGEFVVERACATGSHGDSITIEVAGVRSETVTHG